MPTPPSRGGVSSPFGMRVNPNDGEYRMHYGEDTLGAGNYAPATGTVVFAGWDNTGHGFGWCAGIRESADPSVIWWVAHHGSSPKVNPFVVRVGSPATEGTTYLGPKGDTGAAKGIHCHTERRVGGRAIPGSGTATNPREYYRSGGGGGGFEPERKPIVLETQIYQMVDANGKDIADWSRIGATVLPIGNFPGGYEATADINVARKWGRQLQGAEFEPVKLPRADYIAAQQWGASEYQLHRSADIARIREAVGKVAVEVPPIDYAKVGQAARDAIVKPA